VQINLVGSESWLEDLFLLGQQNAIPRDVFQNDRSCSNNTSTPDANTGEDNGSKTDPYILFNDNFASIRAWTLEYRCAD